ncbi:metallophosphoesterase [Pseudomonas mosselii]|uniref:metallophosphoesterase n=1 Tax=Pseudomonas mosselii TaxID=78327 RepID=UPI00262F3B61|nr:metallophosphoesterase [Pseudomonas mosselii]MDN4496646.1 metallophosphoesterase [Pseudomonas mosselii]
MFNTPSPDFATILEQPEHGPIVLRLPANLNGKDFVVGDVHGHFEILGALLEKAGFNPEVDRVLCTGDLVDRGPYSDAVIEWLAQPWLFSVRGNHEQMVLDHFAGIGDAPRHSRNGGDWFYRLPEARQRLIHQAIQRMPVALEVALAGELRIGVIHAESPCWDEDMSWDDAMALLEAPHQQGHDHALKQAIYARGRINGLHDKTVRGIETLYVGHSTVTAVTRLGNVVYVDTGCSFADGHLTAVELPGQIIYDTRA